MGESKVTFVTADNHRKGDTFKGFNFAVKDELGAAVNCTNVTHITAFFRKTGSAPDANGEWNRSGEIIYTATLANAKIIWINQVTGTLKLVSFDLDWAKGNYLADFEFKWLDGAKETLIDFLQPVEMDTTQPVYIP